MAMATPADNTHPPRVLIASASVGAGHNQVAAALADALRSDPAGIDLEVRDVLDFVPWAFRTYYSGGYSLSVSTFPRLYGLGFWLSDRPQGPRRGLGERLRLWHEGLYLRRFARHVQETRPDLVVHVHFVAAPLLGRMIARGQANVPHVVVVTDIRMHRFWNAEQVDHWFVPAECTAAVLRRWGVEPDRITVSGIAVHRKWTAPLDRGRVLAEWRLPADRPIVVLSGGAEFTCGPVVAIARGLARACRPAFVVVLGGRNKKLLARLAALPESPRDVVGVAFTDKVHELVEVSSLMVTKAGGITTAECLAKATPMVLLRPVPGQESGNAEYFAQQGAAVLAGDADDAVAHVSRLLADEAELARLAANARDLYRPATQTIAEAIRQRAARARAENR